MDWRAVIEGLKVGLVRSYGSVGRWLFYSGLKCQWLFADNWSQKAIRRKTTGTGRMRHLKVVLRRFKNGFREGECWTLLSGLICQELSVLDRAYAKCGSSCTVS